MVQSVPCVDRGNWGRELALCECSVLPWIVKRLSLFTIHGFAKNFLARIAPYTLMSHTKMSIVIGRGRSSNYNA